MATDYDAPRRTETDDVSEDSLEELKAERTTSTFAMEQLDQREIGKLFKNKATRAKSKTKK